MINSNKDQSIKLNIVIVKYGLGSKVISIAKESGISGGTVILGKGTAKSPLLKFLELADYRKEIVLVLSKGNHAEIFLNNAYKKLKLDKPNSGIAFSIPVNKAMGTQYCNNSGNTTNESGGDIMNLYDSIFVIVDRGNASRVVEAANESGARGATIINARGSGIHETSKLFSFEIEPEKEIVLILVEKQITSKVCDLISSRVGIDEPGTGIMFIQSVDEVYGLMKDHI